MKRARYHPAARDELRGAVVHDEAERPGRGAELEAAVGRVLRRVQLFPWSAARWRATSSQPEIRVAPVRHHPYVVVYAVHDDHLVVLAIAHTSKLPGYWRSRLVP